MKYILYETIKKTILMTILTKLLIKRAFGLSIVRSEFGGQDFGGVYAVDRSHDDSA